MILQAKAITKVIHKQENAERNNQGTGRIRCILMFTSLGGGKLVIVGEVWVTTKDVSATKD
jgi:hypothetical protein